MAFKKYAYYNKGNKVGIIESDTSTGGGNLAVAHCTIGGHSTKAACEAAGGQWIPSSSSTSVGRFEKYISPKEFVSKGLEIEYSYAPTFNLQSTGTDDSDYHKFVGWGSDGTNLVLFAWGTSLSTIKNLSSLFSADDWVYIKGSGRWSGLHQVKSTGGATGILTLKTKCNVKAAKISTTVNFTTDETISGVDPFLIESYQEQTESRINKYIFIDEAENNQNAGLLKVTDSSTAGSLKATSKIHLDSSKDYQESTPTFASADDDAITIYNAFYEQITVYENVEVMQDESFELDISDYQSQAVIYYVKAKMAEEMRDMETREYFMRLFKKQIEKSAGAKKRGPYVMQGFGMKNY